ncbi:unnamed protein product [Rhizoctonia solani]|uniref:Uncharacterized protein n=1 Tax=Rhizoctonia solani TaxID=456999 RepID=A0A8H3HE05_9AGAM|nr:unnamed protein product [Rhizoctonia solani]
MARTSLLRGQHQTDDQPDITTYGYDKPLPDAFGVNEGYGFKGGPPAKPLVELEMTRLSAELRRKPFWWTKFRDETILSKWREEALAQAEYMEESHVDYVLKELDGYANLRDEESGAEVSCYDRIWQSDTLVPAALKEQLVAGVAKLEGVPESEKDWHPRSNGQVLDLVHPSLYPIVYGRTLSYPEDSDDRSPAALQLRLNPPTDESRSLRSWRSLNNYFVISNRFQWLPTDFAVSEDGKSVRAVSYINNLHPLKHAELYETIEGIIAAYIPLFERVLTDSIPLNGVVPARTHNDYSYDEDGYRPEPDYEDYPDDDDEYDRVYREWEEGRPIVAPFIREGGYQPGSLEKRSIRYPLGGRTIQVIVKLANIHLTPENPKYNGGSWHVEGMLNEAIAASGIYYYDEENITESRLAFRTAVAGPETYQQNDERGCKLTWGMGRDDPCVNELGAVITCQDRCIAFPNTYQHRVSPFELADKSKPGHRKIVALFLVDPALHRPSTTIVPPQQKEWRASGISANPVLKAAFNKLSPEIIDHIDSMIEGTMTRAEAEAYRLELMDERKAFVAKNDEAFFMAPFDIHSSTPRTDGDPAMQTPYSKPLPNAFGFNDFDEDPEMPYAKTLVELEMTRLSSEIRRKPSWWIKCRDQDILEKWRTEAIAQAKLMKEPYVDYVLKELDGYANLRDETSGAEVSCYDRIWQSDRLISAALKERLIAGARKLENVSEEKKDWHPRSNKQVLDLVHPSLYPLVYGRTLSYPEDSNDRDPATLAARLKPPPSPYSGGEKDYFVSHRFQWLPTDFKVSEDGRSVKSVSYINNLHPIEHAKLHEAIEELVGAYIPLFERVLTDSIPDNGAIPTRTRDYYTYADNRYAGLPRYEDYPNGVGYSDAYREWEASRKFVMPDVKEGGYEPGTLEKRKIKYSLGGRTIQVIVKLANIHLTPENPQYTGGSWHVEGMKNEAIAVSGIYYYDEENITESRLAFRTAVNPPEPYEQSDDRGCRLAWGMARDDPCVNELGSVVTCQDRCIAFPNTYQHRVSPFELADKSKPGHRKIVALFLVDPALHQPSTTIVPPQQKEWRASGINSNPVLKAAFNKLSPEIIDHIDSMIEGTMTRAEAEAYRLELMDERKAFIAKNDEAFFMVPFDMCEH